MTAPPSGTVTFLFTDIEGSTALLRRLRNEYGGALSLHRKLIREAVERRGGFEVDTQGDAFFFAFQRASDGVRAAIDAQHALAEQDWPDGATVRVRMGLHTGEAVLEEDHYHGLPVHRAARIAGAAHGGQVLLSESTRSLLADEEDLSGIGFRNLGALPLKDFDRPIRVFRLSAPGLEDVARRPRGKARTRPRRLILASVVVAIGAAVTIAYISTRRDGSSAVRVPRDSVAVVDPAGGKAREAVSVGRAPNSIALDSSAAWVANGGSGTVTRVDARTYSTSEIGGFESPPFQLTTGAGQVWATEDAAGLASVDVTTQTASAPVPLQAPNGLTYSAQAIAYGFGALWIGGGLPTGLMLLKVDPTSGQVDRSVRVGPLTKHAIAVGAGGVWVSDQLANTVTEFDTKTLRVVRRVHVGGPTAIAVGDGSLWVCGADDRGVWRLTQKSGYRTRTLLSSGGEPVAIAIGREAVWAAVADGTLARIDPNTNSVSLTQIAPTLNGVVVGDGAVWALAGPVRFL